jgi:hypothetical protein
MANREGQSVSQISANSEVPSHEQAIREQHIVSNKESEVRVNTNGRGRGAEERIHEWLASSPQPLSVNDVLARRQMDGWPISFLDVQDAIWSLIAMGLAEWTQDFRIRLVNTDDAPEQP